MKKLHFLGNLLLVTVLVTTMTGFMGCTKPDNNNPSSDDSETPKLGVYSPGKKIKKLSFYKNGNLTGWENWKWNGNLLESIEKVGDAELLFSYDENNRMARMDIVCRGGNGNWLFDYVENGVAIGWLQGDDIVYDYNHDCDILCQNDKISEIRLDEGWDMYFDWLDENVKSVRWESNSFNYEYTEDYKYDNRHNPFRGLLPYYFMESEKVLVGLSGGWSKSNAIKVIHDGNIQYQYDYEYDSDGYPTSCVITEPGANGYDYDGTVVNIEYL